MKHNIISIILIFCISLFVSGCNNNTSLNSISSISVFEKANANITSGSQIKYQDDWANTLEEIYNSESVKNNVFIKYGIKNIPNVNSMNEKNTLYKINLECGKLNENECIDAHNLYNSELLTKIKDVYNIDISIIDGASITQK